MSVNPFDQFDNEKDQVNPFDQFDESPKRTLKGTGNDILAATAEGVIGATDALVGIADIPTLGRAGKAAKLVGLNEVYNDPQQAQQAFDQDVADRDAGVKPSYVMPSPYSEAQQSADRKLSQAEGVFGKLGAAIQNPSTIAKAVYTSVPTIIEGGMFGRAAATLAPKVAPAIEGAIAKFAPKIAPAIATALPGAVGEGLVGMGAAAEQVRSEGSTGVLTPKQAAMTATSGAATGALSMIGGAIASKFGFNDVDTMLAGVGTKTAQQGNKGVIRRILEGGFSEATFEELPQSIQEQLWNNAALDKPLMEGVDEAAVMGWLSGAAMGAGANLAPSPQAPPQGAPLTVQPPAQEVPPPVIEDPANADIERAFRGGWANTMPVQDDPDTVAWGQQIAASRQYNQDRNIPTVTAEQDPVVGEIERALSPGIKAPERLPLIPPSITPVAIRSNRYGYQVSPENEATVTDVKQSGIGDRVIQGAMPDGRTVYRLLDDKKQPLSPWKTFEAPNAGRSKIPGDTQQAGPTDGGNEGVLRGDRTGSAEDIGSVGTETVGGIAPAQQPAGNIDPAPTVAGRGERGVGGRDAGDSGQVPGSGVVVQSPTEVTPAVGQTLSQNGTNAVSPEGPPEPDLLTRARQHVAETGDTSMGGMSKALDVNIDTAADLIERVKEEQKSATDPTPASITDPTVKESLTVGDGGASKQPWEMTRSELAAQGKEKAIRDIEKLRGERAGIMGTVPASVTAGNLTRKGKRSNGAASAKTWWDENARVLNVIDIQIRNKQLAIDAYGTEDSDERLAEFHRKVIAHALREGKSVPQSVMAEYPELANRNQNRAERTEFSRPVRNPGESARDFLARKKGWLNVAKVEEVVSSKVEPASKEKTIRLYRAESTKPSKQPAEWISQSDSFKNNVDAGGRWFTDDREEAQWYLDNEYPDGGRIVSVDVPASEAEQYRVSNMNPSGGGKAATGNPRAFSRRPEKEFFLPREMADRKQPEQQPTTPATDRTPETPGGLIAAGTQPTVEKVRDVYGKTHYVRKDHLDGDRNALPLFDKDGKRKSGAIVRANIDIDGSKQAARNEEFGTPALIYREDESGAYPYASKSAVTRELRKRGIEATHEAVPARDAGLDVDGFVGKKKATGAKTNSTADLPSVSTVTEREAVSTPAPQQPQPEADNGLQGKKEEVVQRPEAFSANEQGAEVNGEAKATAGTLTKPAPKESPAPVAEAPKQEGEAGKAADKLEDFGEKIGGARKDVWSSFKDKLADVKDADIASQPLSKIWPIPDYKAMLDGGADSLTVSIVRALRDAIPAKPKQSWRLSRWSEVAGAMRKVAVSLLDGSASTDKAMSTIQGLSITGLKDQIDLYQVVGHEKSLAGVRIAVGEYSMLDGVEYKPKKTVWSVEQEAKKTAMSNWPRMMATGNTREEAISNFANKYSELDINKPAEKQVDFVIYSTQGVDGFFIGKKIGRNYADLAGPFKTAKEARAHKTEKHDELLAKLEKYKEIPSERRDTNEPRAGVDMRGGQDVTPEMFQEAFGFRGVEFGNWVEGSRRQEDLNNAYDALMDMAAVIGIPPKAISLNGELGLAFGARGSGGINPAIAHYESTHVVINLTKKKGAGSLGHEWWHALDNYFSRMRGEKSSHMTDSLDVTLVSKDSNYIHKGAVRKAMVDAFGGVMRAVRKTAIRARSAKLDQRRSKDYWTTKPEMSARAFESYLISKLHDQNASNDYLANIVAPETWKAAESLGFELDESYPYPTAGELPTIRAAFDHLFNTIEAKPTDKGVALMSSTSQPIPPAQRADIAAVDNAALDGVKSSTGSVDAALKKEGFKVNEKDREATDELEAVVNYAFDATPWRLPDTAVGRDRKGRVEQGGTPRSDLEVAERLAKIFDKRIVWATFSNPTINGLIVSRNRALDGLVFLNPTSKNPAHVIFGHELSHWMEAEHPEIYAELYDAIQPLIVDTAAYRSKFANLQGASDFDVNTEIIGDVMGDAFGDPNFWGEVAQQAGGKKFRGMAKKVIQWINSILDKIRGMAGYESRQLVRDLNKAKLAIARATSKYAEAKGNAGSAYAGVKQSVSSIMRNYATWTEQRIDNEMDYAAYNDGRTKALVAFINPADFVKATTPTKESLDRIYEESGSLDIGKLTDETQSPYLRIRDGVITGHEGRHRMAALAKAGVKEVPVVLDYGDGGNREGAMYMRLLGQKFGDGRGENVGVTEAIPITYDNRKKIESRMKSGGIQFSNATLFQPVDTNSAAFRRWFSGSKVVGEDGEPLRVYHGGRAGISEFKNKHGVHYFTPTKGMANLFALERKNISGPLSAYVSLKSPLMTKDETKTHRMTAQGKDSLVSQGYDGAILLDDDGNIIEVVAFESTQIKSADQNTGDFSPTDPRIQYSTATAQTSTPAFQRWFGRSKITSNGQPQVLYHGTTHPRFLKDGEYPWIFDQNRPRNPANSNLSGLGIFLGGMDSAEAHAGMEGTVHPFYVRMENPYVTTAAELEKKVESSGAEVFRKRLQELSGHDGIIITDRGHAIVFGASQVKSATDNTGAFSENGDVRYSNSMAAGEPGPMSLGNLEATAKDMAKAAKKGTITFKKNPKKDSSFLERLLSTPEYYFKKTSASAGRVLQAALLRRDVRFEKQQEILGGFVKFVQDLRKTNPSAYTEANDYLVEMDQEGGWFRVKEKEGQWFVIGPNKEEVSDHITEAEAVAGMIQAEAVQMKDEGYSDAAIETVKMARELTNRAFDVMAADMRRIIEEAKANGRPNPFIGSDKIDEAGRYGVYAAGSKKPLALFPTEDEAAEMLGKVTEIVAYSVVSANGKVKSFTSMLKAKKWAAKRGGKIESTKRFSNLTVKRRSDSEMRPMTVKEALAQMGDLRGSYFPRIRENGEYVLIARKDGENPFRQSFDLPGVGDNHPMLQKLMRGVSVKGIGIFVPISKKAEELKAKGYTVTISRDDKPTDDVFDATSLITSLDAILQESMGGINKNDSNEVKAAQVVDQIITMQIADIFKARGYLASRMKRLGGEETWEGYETDMGKALTQYGKNIAAGTAKRDTARAMVLAFTGRDYSWNDYKAEVENPTWEEYKTIVDERRIDPGKQKNLFKDVRSFIVDVLRNDEQSDRIVGTMKGIAVHKFLGLRVSSAAINATNMVTGVVGTMSGSTGESITKSMRRVLSAAVAYGQYRTGKGTAEDREIFQEITNRGWDEAQFDHEAMSELRSKAGDLWNKYEAVSMFMFSAVEKANRAMTIHAALKAVIAKNPKMGREEQWNMAQEVSNKAHGVYGKETLPAIARGGDLNRMLRLPLTFTKFTHNYMLNMIDMGFNRKEYKAAAYLLLSPAIIAGSGATLATPALLALASALGIGGDDPEEEWYKWAEETFGGGTFARHGLAGLAGINIKGSMAINVPMPSDIAKIKLVDIFGPVGGVVGDIAKGVGSIAKGDTAKGIEALLPTALGSVSKALRERSEGITTSNYGSVFYGDEPLKATDTDAFLRFISFNPSRISGIREMQWNEKEVAAKYQERRTKIYSAIKRDHLQGKGISPESLKEIKRYNELVDASGRDDISKITRQKIKIMLKRSNKPNKRERERQ